MLTLPNIKLPIYSLMGATDIDITIEFLRDTWDNRNRLGYSYKREHDYQVSMGKKRFHTDE